MILKINELKKSYPEVTFIESDDILSFSSLRINESLTDFMQYSKVANNSVIFFSYQYYSKDAQYISETDTQKTEAFLTGAQLRIFKQRVEDWNAFLDKQDYSRPFRLTLLSSLGNIPCNIVITDPWMHYKRIIEPTINIMPFTEKATIVSLLAENLSTNFSKKELSTLITEFVSKLVIDRQYCSKKNCKSRYNYITTVLAGDGNESYADAIKYLACDSDVSTSSMIKMLDNYVYQLRYKDLAKSIGIPVGEPLPIGMSIDMTKFRYLR